MAVHVGDVMLISLHDTIIGMFSACRKL